MSKPPKRKSWKKWILLVTSIVVSLAIAEVGSRLAGPVEWREPPRIKKGEDAVWRSFMHQPSEVPGLAYELAPNREKIAQGAMVRTNSFGMRDDEPIAEKADDLTRIVVIGDSYTFGFGVAGENTYVNVLERMLNESAEGGRRFETLNLGVGGYSTRDEAIVLEHKVARFQPDLVLVGYVLNDPEIDPIQSLHAAFAQTSWWQHSSALRRVSKARFDADLESLGGGEYYRYLHAHEEKWASVVLGFADMGSFARSADLPVVVVIFPVIPNGRWREYPYADLHQKVAAAADAAGLPVIDLLPGLRRYEPSQIRRGQRDAHPNRPGHRVIAEILHRRLRAESGPLAVPGAVERQERRGGDGAVHR
jgi:lysophospholipase L1-like esterase